MQKTNIKQLIKNGILKENPTFSLMLGLCPTLGVTTSFFNGLAMGLATTCVLILSNVIISSIRKLIPGKIRIPVYITIMATIVTVVELFLHAYFFDIYKVLGIFIPLIVVNCIILGRAESFASKNNPVASFFDGIGIGAGFTLSLSLIGFIRELIGNGTILSGTPFEAQAFGKAFEPAIIFLLSPGAFITIGMLMWLINIIRKKVKKGA